MTSVSIIIPIYNIEKYLEKAICSAIGQTEKDIEIILVDDGSCDKSGNICDRYAETDSRIKVIHKENGGLSSARNAGADIASGEYIMFLDGDDYLRHDAVECLLRTAQKSSYDCIQFLYQEVSDGRLCENELPFEAEYVAETPRELFDSLYNLGGVAASGCTKLIRRELVRKFPYLDMNHEDEMWCSEVFEHASVNPIRIAYIPENLYYYVLHENSIIRSGYSEKKLDIFKMSEARIEVLRRLGFEDLLHHEYERIFGGIVGIYCMAKKEKNSSGKKLIKEKFLFHKANIARSAHLSGKRKLLFFAMRICFCVLDIYCIMNNKFNLKKNAF